MLANSSYDVLRVAYRRALDERRRIPEAQEEIEAFLADSPDDPVALAIKGSLLAIQADAESLPWKKLALLNQGGSLMDCGVSIADLANLHGADAIAVRMIRGVTCGALPPPFRRDRTTYEDLTTVLDHPEACLLNDAERAEAATSLARVAGRLGRSCKRNEHEPTREDDR